MYSKLPSDRLREIHQQFFGILFSDEFRRIHYMFKNHNSWFWYMLFCFGPRANNLYIYIESHFFWMFSDTGSQVSSKMSSSLLAIGFCALAGLAILAEHVIFRTDGDMEIVANWLLD